MLYGELMDLTQKHSHPISTVLIHEASCCEILCIGWDEHEGMHKVSNLQYPCIVCSGHTCVPHPHA